jgi:hypothetical protein
MGGWRANPRASLDQLSKIKKEKQMLSGVKHIKKDRNRETSMF